MEKKNWSSSLLSQLSSFFYRSTIQQTFQSLIVSLPDFIFVSPKKKQLDVISFAFQLWLTKAHKMFSQNKNFLETKKNNGNGNFSNRFLNLDNKKVVESNDSERFQG